MRRTRFVPSLLGCVVLILFVLLVSRISRDYHWSDWGFGDAQTMLSLNQWERGGWLDNYLLFKPQGYAPIVDLLDQPGLRQHAHGISPSGVGPRLWYTHYPAGYLFPYATLYRFGVTSLFGLQLFSICISLAGLVLMYRLFSLIANPVIGLAAVVYYGSLPVFLRYAYSIANQPLDDLLRFAFMLSVVLSTRAAKNRGRWLVLAWVLEFLLSSSSFDSVFYLYAWLIGWYLLEGKGRCWQIWLLFPLAPLSAHALQFLQNVWYLGWEDAVRDVLDTFLRHQQPDAAAVPSPAAAGRLSLFRQALGKMFVALFASPFNLAVLVAIYLLAWRQVARNDTELPSPLLLGLLFFCGLAYPLVLPVGANMTYQGRQLAPFASLLAGALLWLFWTNLRCGLAGFGAGGRSMTGMGAPFRSRAYLTAMGVLLLAVSVVNVQRGAGPSSWNAMFEARTFVDHLFAEELRAVETAYEPVYLVTENFMTAYSEQYVPGYPQILPFTEYYAGSRLFLCFNNPQLLARDLRTILDRTDTRFSPVLIAQRPEVLENTLRLLRQIRAIGQGDLPLEFPQRQGVYFFDLTPLVLWRN